jgi:hypothetical protein
MANECLVELFVNASDKQVLQHIYDSLQDIGWNGCYGYRDIELTDNGLNCYGTVKWNPPREQMNEWISMGASVTCYFVEEFLHFAGVTIDGEDEFVDFETTSSHHVRSAAEGLLYDLDGYFGLADHMDEHQFNGHNELLLHST